jgi:hypothetical protein
MTPEQLAECQQKLEMAEAIIAGDGALITGLKEELAELEDDEQKAVERCVIAEQKLAQCQAREIRKNDAIDCAVYYINNPGSSKPFALSVCDDARKMS